MTGLQFEELARVFVAHTLGIPVEKVRWQRFPAATRPGHPHDTYQVDLLWEMETPLGQYLTIADAKYRIGHKIDRDDILLLEQFRQGVGAHKAILITNAQCTEGVLTTAERLGIAVHQLIPQNLDPCTLPRTNRPAIIQAVQQARARGPAWKHTIIRKGLSSRTKPFNRPF